MTSLLRQAIRQSGESFMALEQATGITRQSLMRFAHGQQSLRLDMADRLVDYFGVELRWKGKTRKGTEMFRALVEPDHVWGWDDIKTGADVPPRGSGLYAWWFDEVPPLVPTDATITKGRLHLLYVGISPRRPAGNGAQPSRETLRSRIRGHYRGKAEGSTLRMTLGCLLAETLDITLTLSAAGKRKTFDEGELRLSEWMCHHAFVSWMEYPNPWDLEEDAIRRFSLPFNIQHNQHHAFYRTLRQTRRSALAAARQVWADGQ